MAHCDKTGPAETTLKVADRAGGLVEDRAQATLRRLAVLEFLTPCRKSSQFSIGQVR
jgi:hypothetical protein